MKKYIISFIVLFALSGITACNKILDKKPIDFLEPESYYNSEEKLEASLAGVYDEVGSQGLYGLWMLYRLGLEADEGYYNRTSPITGPQVNDLTSSDADINRTWTSMYTGIGRANNLIANIDVNPEIDQAFRDRILGEALFLRGYYYFLLVQYFGGVPLVLEPMTDVNDVDIPRASIKEVYDQILSDMETAEGLVEDIRTLGYGGRVNKSAVRGMLARVCLYMAGRPLQDVSKYADARAWAKKVMDDGEAAHSLIPEFSRVFINYAQDKYDVSESIWEVEFSGNGTDAYAEWGGVGYVNGPRTTNTDIGYGTGSISGTAKLYNAYQEGDLRRDWTLTNFTYNNADGSKKFMTNLSVENLYKKVSAKYRREYETLTPKTKSATPQNYAILRYSDILLMFAEAENEVNKGPSAEAIEAVNQVRRRAWSTGVKSVNITSGGSGYTEAPVVRFQGGGGSGALARAIIDDGQVTGVEFAPDAVTGSRHGSGYSTAPAVIFEGGGGSGAQATAEIFHKEDGELSEAETASYEAFRQTLQDERLRELAFESQRKSDLVRWGIFLYEMGQIANHIRQHVPDANYLRVYENVWERHLLWPIPAREMALNDALVQNPNW